MTPDPIQRAFSSDEDVAPSSRFTAAVMEMVRREAALQPPIPFPWRRLVAVVATTGAVAAVLVSSGQAQAIASPVAAAIDRVGVRVISFAVETRLWTSAVWTAGALLVSFASWRLGLRFAWPHRV